MSKRIEEDPNLGEYSISIQEATKLLKKSGYRYDGWVNGKKEEIYNISIHNIGTQESTRLLEESGYQYDKWVNGKKNRWLKGLFHMTSKVNEIFKKSKKGNVNVIAPFVEQRTSSRIV